ncbi:MAG TPA: O-antigen ligase family protein, partial [Bacteroidales bacterium]|nr:O-antigen ligase family protein [Bacteroidales bacterium]
SGWFYSANELSVIVIILLTLTIIYFHEKRTFLPLIAFSFILSMIPMIGTKTAFYGAIIIIISFFALSIFTKQIKQNFFVVARFFIKIMYSHPYQIN